MQSIQRNNGNNGNNVGNHSHWIPPTEDDAEDQMFTGETSEFGMKVFSDPLAQATFKNCEDNYKKMMDLKRAYDNQDLLRKMHADLRREYLTRKKQVKRLQMAAAVYFRNAHYSLEQHHRMVTDTFGGCKFGVCSVDISAPLVSQIQLPNGETVDLKTFNKHLEFDKVRQMHECIRLEQFRGAFGGCYDEEDDSDGTPSCLYRRDGTEVATRTRGAFGGCYDHYDEEEEQQQQQQEQQQQEQQEQEQQQQEEPEQQQEQEEQEPEQDEEQEQEEEHDDDDAAMQTPDCVVDYPLERAGNSTKAKKPAAAKAKAKAKKPAAAKQIVKKQKFVPFQIEDNTNHENNQETLPASKIEIDMPKKYMQNASREDKKRHNQKWKRINAEQKFTNTRTHGPSAVPVADDAASVVRCTIRATKVAKGVAIKDIQDTQTTKTPITIYQDDGSMYEGFVNEHGEKHGQGKLKTAICISGVVGDENSHMAKWTTFEGQWCNGLLHGQAVMREMSDKGVVRIVHDGMWDTGVAVVQAVPVVQDRAAVEQLIMASLTTRREFEFIEMCDNQSGGLPWCCDN